MCRSSGAQRLVTRDQVAQLLVGHHPAPGAGSPPSSRTTRFVHWDSSQTSGRGHLASRSTTGAATSDTRSAPLQRQPLGRQLAEDQREERDHQRHDDQPRPPWRRRAACRDSARLASVGQQAAPKAPDSSVANVTPIWTEDRNRLGSWASRAARWPRLPCLPASAPGLHAAIRAPSRRRRRSRQSESRQGRGEYPSRRHSRPDPRPSSVRLARALPSPAPGRPELGRAVLEQSKQPGTYPASLPHGVIAADVTFARQNARMGGRVAGEGART